MAQTHESAPLSVYEAICEHAELELELAGNGDVTGVAALAERWPMLMAALPASTPKAAEPLLAQACLVHERTRVELLRLRELLQAELARTTRVRRTADGYAGQLRRRPRLDRSV